jgi:hypothetical protein
MTTVATSIMGHRADFVGLVLVLCCISAAQADEAEQRIVGPFTRIELQGWMDTIVRVGEEQAITVIADNQEYVDRIATFVRDDTLFVDMRMRLNLSTLVRHPDAKIRISVPFLAALAMNGAGNLEIHDVNTETFGLVFDGMGDAFVHGRCGSAALRRKGHGELRAGDLECQRVKLDLNGAGGAGIYASEYAKVDFAGIGEVSVYGSPKVTEFSKRGLGRIIGSISLEKYAPGWPCPRMDCSCVVESAVKSNDKPKPRCGTTPDSDRL